jgi:hypothetical protein
MASDQAQLADVMVQLALLKQTKDNQKRDLKVAKASKAVTKDAQALLDSSRKSIRELKKRRDAIVLRLVRARQSKT